MGATSLCPGSHYCTDGPISAFCEEAGIHVVNKDGYTKGDALIMNMNSYHRGGAHVDYGGLDRVMLILTFSPKPRTQAESRQMSQGITFQQRWDMWGHTLNDLANANTVMVQPWVILRSLGLYKLPGTAWGIDYITSSAQRIVSVDNGFRRFDLVDGLLATGGFPFLPPFLHAKISKTDSWYEFLSATLELCVDFMKSVSMGAVGLYVLSTLILCIPMKQRVSFFRNAMIRMLIIIGITALLFTMAKKYSDESDWAKDHAAERKFTSLVKYERMAVKNACSDNIKGRVMFCSNTKKRPTTFPHQTDFLIETRLGSESFAAFNNFIDGHPGNIVVRTAIQSASIAATFNDYSLFFKNAVARYISGLIFSGRGRFLYQKPDGAWVRLSESEADAFTKQELWFQTNKVAKFATNWIRMIGSDFRFGVYRDTSMAIHHSRRFMQDLEQKILKRMHSSIGLETTSSTPDAEPTQNRSRLFKLPPSPSTRREALVPHPGALRSRDLSPQPTEPRPGAWLEQGDVVEAMTEVDEKGWYGAKILRVSSDGRYTLQFGDGTFESVDLYKVRNVQPFAVDEKIDVMLDDQEYHEYEVVEMNPDGTVNAKSLESEEIMEDIPPLHMMRTGGYTPRKPDRNSPVYGLAVGALVEVKSETEEDLWYTGSITSISTDGDYVYKIDFVDGASQSVSDSRTIRPVSEYRPGEILMVDRDEEYKFMAKLSYGSFQAMHIATGEVVDGFTAQDVGRTGRFSL